MAIFLVQLAKMTLVVLGIFFTPMITRKFVQTLRLPVAQDMMKWGGLGWAAASFGALKAFRAGSSVSGGAWQFAKKEAPSVFHHARQASRAPLSAISSKEIPVLSAGAKLVDQGIESANNTVRAAHLKEEAKKDGLHIPTKKEQKLAKYDPRLKSKLDDAQSKLDWYLKEKEGKKDPISGRLENPYVPPAQKVVSTMRASARVAEASTNALKSTTDKFARSFSTSRSERLSTTSVGTTNSTPSPSVQTQSGVNGRNHVTTSARPQVNVAVNPERNSSPQQGQKLFLDRVRAIQSNGLKPISEILKIKKEKS